MDDLPTKDEYIASIKPTEDPGDCSICSDAFTNDHAPVKLDECGHVFGHQCIVSWFESGPYTNTCPLCRHALFEAEGSSDEENSNEDSDEDDSDDEDSDQEGSDEEGSDDEEESDEEERIDEGSDVEMTDAEDLDDVESSDETSDEGSDYEDSDEEMSDYEDDNGQGDGAIPPSQCWRGRLRPRS